MLEPEDLARVDLHGVLLAKVQITAGEIPRRIIGIGMKVVL